jgi:hypothetical protein
VDSTCVTIDCADARLVAEFWNAALGLLRLTEGG